MTFLGFSDRSVDCTLKESVDASSSYVEEEHYPDDEVKHKLEILPDSLGPMVKRVNETLNLTCHVIKESGPFLKFMLEWHLPQTINNRYGA